MESTWKKAVVHLEPAGDKTAWSEQMRMVQQMWEEQKKGQRPLDEIAPEYLPKSRDHRCRGTALFVRHEGKRYLVTARHVVTDPELAAQSPGMDYPDHFPDAAARRQERIDRWIYPIIFRVPSLDEIKRWTSWKPPAFLMNLMAGVPWMHPYTFSTPHLDLAVISLNQHDRGFADELEAAGYVPVTLDDVAEQPSTEGAEIYSVGYPDATAVLGKLNLPDAALHWSSGAFSVPVFSFGRVAMLRDDLPSFLADLSVYPGNSGGPVMENGKLVGIVSSQAAVEDVRIPFATVIKSTYIRELIRQQAEKDGHLPVPAGTAATAT